MAPPSTPQDAKVEPPPTSAPYWVYMLRCADGTLYTGVARDVEKRLAEHNGERGRGARYTAPRRPVRIVYQAEFPDRSSAQKEEARIKALPRAAKQCLIPAKSGKPRRHPPRVRSGS